MAKKVGTPNKFSSSRVEAAKKTGPLPAEGALTIYRNLMALANRYLPRPDNPEGNESKYREIAKEALDAVRVAAPYYDQKLATKHIIEERRLDPSQLSLEELEIIERAYARGAIVGGDTGGDNAPPRYRN